MVSDESYTLLKSLLSLFNSNNPVQYNNSYLYFLQAKAAVGDYKEALEIFSQIQSEKITNDYVYLSWVARCCKKFMTTKMC